MKTETIILGVALWACQSAKSNNRKTKPDTIMHMQTEPNYEVPIQFVNNYVAFCNVQNTEIGRMAWVNSQAGLSAAFKSELSNKLPEAKKKPRRWA